MASECGGFPGSAGTRSTSFPPPVFSVRNWLYFRSMQWKGVKPGSKKKEGFTNTETVITIAYELRIEQTQTCWIDDGEYYPNSEWL